MKIFILEDDHNVIKKFVNKFNNTDILIYPNKFDESTDFENCNFVIDKVKKNEFNSLIQHFADIDLFIIDITLISKKSNDILGLDFYNHLKNNNYKNGNYDVIFLTRHSKSTEQFRLASEAIDIAKIFSKEVRVTGDYTDKVVEYINNNFNKELNYNKTSVSIEKMEEYSKAYLEKGFSIFFYILMIIGSIYAFWNLARDFSSPFRDNTYKIEISKLQDSIKFKENISIEEIRSHNNQIEVLINKLDIEKLKVVEHIFIFLLPLFIIMGFYNYFKYTTSVMLTGDKESIDNPKAMKSLNASKMILISSILSFALIKLIEILSLKTEIKIELIISFGVLIIVLMIFILFLHKQEH